MGRRRSEPGFDAGAAAIKEFEELTGETSPDESWRRRYFILDARRDLEGLRDRVEELEGGVDELETERDMVKEDWDEWKERAETAEQAVRKAVEALKEVDEKDMRKVLDAYPAKCKFRGFAVKSEEKGFRRVSRYMKKHAERLLKKALE